MVEQLWVKNYRSLKDVRVTFGHLNVLVGLNGSGKSSLIDVLRFVSDTLLLGLEAAIFKRQGMRALRRWSANNRAYDVEIGLAIKTDTFSAQYEFVLGSVSGKRDDYYVKKEACLIEKDGQKNTFQSQNGTWIKKPANIHPQIQPNALLLPLITAISPFQYLYNFIKGMSFYNIWPAALREPQKFVTPYPLESDGRNFAAALFELERRQDHLRDALKNALNFVLFEIDDYQIDLIGNHLVVKLHHQYAANGQSPWFEVTQLSDGTLRMLGILMALYQDPPRTLIALEEPELTVHPYIMVRLWDELVDASERSQIILTTHSPDLLDLCTVEQLHVVEKVDGITYVGRLDERQKRLIQEDHFAPGQVLKALGTLNRAIED